MKQGLQLKLGQQLAITPQLQQAIRLLQLSSAELQQEIQLALESNPFLEQIDFQPPEYLADHNLDNPDTNQNSDSFSSESPIPDTDWQDNNPAAISEIPPPSGINQQDYLPYEGATLETLRDYLFWQLNLTPLSDVDTAIAIALIDALDDSGYLTLDPAEIATDLNADSIQINANAVELVLKRLQHFDPPGIAARDLRECLLIQLNQLDLGTPFLAQAKLILQQDLSLLGKQDLSRLASLCQLQEATVKSALTLIQHLNPRPGEAINNHQPTYVIPDVIVYKRDQGWIVELNPATLPRIQLSPLYVELDSNSYSEQDNQYIRHQRQEAKWLLKSLENRHDTLLKVASCIVDAQQDFFALGAEYMKPLIMAEIAQRIGVHESTISRTTTRKYIHSPQGIFELKYFFSRHLNTDQGGETSAIATQALLKKLIATENPAKPLSDSQLVTLFAEKGIVIARRTIAKYRDVLHILPSSQRKKSI